MENNNLSGMIEAALMAVIANIILMLGNFVPFVGTLILAIAPMPFIVIALRRPYHYTAASVGVASLLAFILMPFPISLMMPLYAGVVGLNMGYWMKRGTNASMTILYTGIVTTISVFMILGIFESVSGITFSEVLMKEYELVKNGLMTTPGSANFSDAVNSAYSDIEIIVTSLFPALMITAVAMVVSANYFATRAVLVRLRLPVTPIESFARFRYPNTMIYGVTFMLILSYLAGYLKLVNPDLLLANLVIMVLYLLMIQGLAVIYYWLDKNQIPNQIRIFILAGLLIMQMGPILSMVGWIDSIVDFRAIHRKKLPKD